MHHGKAIPQLRKYMTLAPKTIGADDSVAHAHALMREGNLRHLPVMDHGKLVGVVSDGDLLFSETLISGDAQKISVRDAMRPEPFTASPDAPLDEICAEMSRRKIGSTIAVENGKIVGIFTAVDAQNALTDLLRTRLH